MTDKTSQFPLIAFQTKHQSAGSVMLEFVLAAPVVLSLILACMQFAHIWMAKQVVHYAAFCAARATLVCHKSERNKAAEQAAQQVCAWIVHGQTAGEPDKRIPGWGPIPGSGGAPRKTRIKRIRDIGRWNVEVTIQHDFALLFPLVGPMIGWALDPWGEHDAWLEKKVDATGNIGKQDVVQYPHIRFTETVVLPKPYVTVSKMGLPAPGW